MKQYYIDYENMILPKCKCGKDLKYTGGGLNFQSTCGEKNCLRLHKKNIKVSEDTKIKISEAMKKLSNDGKLQGWLINKDENRRSYPEKFFIKLMEMNDLYSKYTIKEKLSFDKYFLDFALLEIKIDIEIDGQQHFVTPEAIQHDLIRDKYLIDHGWRVYRITWLRLRENPKLIIDNLLKWLSEKDIYYKYDVNEILDEIHLRKILRKEKIKETRKEFRRQNKKENKKENKIPDNHKRIDYFNKRKNEYTDKNLPMINKITQSDINFSKQGWVKNVSKILGISENKGGWWMKRNMLDFYNEKCWKRNAPII